MKDVVLAVDGGNSKTDVALCTVGGELLAAVRGPTTSHQAVGLEPGLDRLSGLLGRVLAEAGLSGAGGPRLPVAELAVCCLAGMDLPADELRLAEAYRARRAGRGDAAVQRHVRRPSRRHARWLGGRGDLRVWA